MSALNKYDFAYRSILTIFAAPRRRPEPYNGREWVRPRLSLCSYMMSATGQCRASQPKYEESKDDCRDETRARDRGLDYWSGPHTFRGDGRQAQPSELVAQVHTLQFSEK